MRKLITTGVALGLLLALNLNVVAEETTGEAAEATTNDVSRSATQAKHRVEEATCTGSAAECAAQKVKNRAKEAGTSVKDKASKLKHKMD